MCLHNVNYKFAIWLKIDFIIDRSIHLNRRKISFLKVKSSKSEKGQLNKKIVENFAFFCA